VLISPNGKCLLKLGKSVEWFIVGEFRGVRSAGLQTQAKMRLLSVIPQVRCGSRAPLPFGLDLVQFRLLLLASRLE
jgi:hypothetical protein